MIFHKSNYWLEQLTFSGTNQHGDRFKHDGSACVKVCRIESGKNIDDYEKLCVISDQLEAPVRWDNEKKVGYIEIMAAKTVREKTNNHY